MATWPTESKFQKLDQWSEDLLKRCPIHIDLGKPNHAGDKGGTEKAPSRNQEVAIIVSNTRDCLRRSSSDKASSTAPPLMCKCGAALC